jgi:F-box/leucine-rich repeat protein 14
VSSLASLTFLDLSDCRNVTDEGMRAVSNCTALKSLNLFYCDKLTDEGCVL